MGQNIKKYKSKLWFLAFLILGSMSILFACNKEHNAYYNFQNEERIYSGSSLEYLKSQDGEYDSMLTVIKRVGWIEDSLSNGKTMTIFAIPNQCFSTVIQNLNSLRHSENKSSLYLQSVDSSQLDTLISRYLIPGLYPTDSITFIDGMKVPSLKYKYNMQVQPLQVNASGLVDGGPNKLYFSDPKNSRYTRDWVRTTTKAVNIMTSDGVVHLLSSNHNFGFQEFVERMNH